VNGKHSGDLPKRVHFVEPAGDLVPTGRHWGEPLQIANITSRPRDESCQTSVGCNLDHVTA